MPATKLPAPATVFELPRNMEKAWCVYQHAQFNDATQRDELIFYGTCKLTSVFDYPDAYRNSEWKKIIKPEIVLIISILSVGTVSECREELRNLLRYHRPICNAKGVDMIGQATLITCNETGQQWANQQACSRALNINQGALSQHLAGKPGYNKVKGMTFRRGA